MYKVEIHLPAGIDDRRPYGGWAILATFDTEKEANKMVETLSLSSTSADDYRVEYDDPRQLSLIPDGDGGDD